MSTCVPANSIEPTQIIVDRRESPANLSKSISLNLFDRIFNLLNCETDLAKKNSQFSLARIKTLTF